MAIVLEGIRVERDGKCILDVPHLEIGAKPTLLLGLNGAGKSTLMSVIAGNAQQTSGTVEKTQPVIYVEQRFHPIIGFTSSEYCAYVAWLSGQDRKRAREEAFEWLKFVGLENAAQQKCESLSGGQQSRLAIATALNSGAGMLLLDEPSAALDPLSKDEITHVYKKIAESGQPLLVSTHDAGELQDPFQRIIVLHHGQIGFEGDRQAFLRLAQEPNNSPVSLLAKSFANRRLAGDT